MAVPEGDEPGGGALAMNVKPNLYYWALASVAALGGEEGGGGATSEQLPPGTEAPGSDFRRWRLPVVPVAAGYEPWCFSPGAQEAASETSAAYITLDAVLRAPGDPSYNGYPASGLHGCLWPPRVEVAGSSDVNTPSGEEAYTHVSLT
jgi:hypothetical protein